MPVLQLTTKKFLEWGADKLLESQPLTAERKREIRPVTEFNLLVTCYNVAHVILSVAALAAAFFAFTPFVGLSLIGLTVRYISNRELEKYTLPYQPPQEAGPVDRWAQLRNLLPTNLLRHALHQANDDEKIVNTFENLRLPRQEGWEPNMIQIDEFAFWKYKIDVPPAAVPAAQPAAAAAPVAAVAEAAVGGLAGLARMAVAAARGAPPAAAAPA